MYGIRSLLEQFDLVTEPDFQSVWPDSLVSITLRDGTQNESAPESDNEAACSEKVGVQTEVQVGIDPALEVRDEVEGTIKPKGETLNTSDDATGLVEVGGNNQIDPIARVSSIPAAQCGVSTVLLSDSIERATTKMSLDGYSQLAIMQGDREVRGMISWESIAKRSMLAPPPTTVAECRMDAQVVDADSSLYDALPAIARHGYVLVRSPEKKIVGIVTASDLAAEFGEISYAFMSLRTIEILIRGKLHPRLTQDDLCKLEEHSLARVESDPARLTFGENVRLMQRPEVWARLEIKIDKDEVISRLLEVRDIRNDVMHFDPEPLTPEEKQKLNRMEAFLRQAFI
jgi:predicted transcriptional regulator